jgi:hypothetical protein
MQSPACGKNRKKVSGQCSHGIREQHSQFPMGGKAAGIPYARFRMRLVNDGDTRPSF